jgi:ribosome-associated toxin RatA of RatAB toxin-antitoxin module
MAKFKTNFNQIVLLASISLLSEMLILPSAISSPNINSAVVADSNNEALTAVADRNNETAIATANKKDGTHIVATTTASVFKADDAEIWKILVDFQKYPAIFNRIESVQITKNDGGLVYTESRLKPGVFVQRAIQHTVNDISAGPKLLNWHMLDGNFKYLKGKWEIKQLTANTSAVKYTLFVDLGPLVPPPLINFVVHHVQQEIVADLKKYVEAEYRKKGQIRQLSNASARY